MPPERIGKYRVIRKIASGGMAEVYLCRLTGEEGFEKKIAVKVIRSRLSEDRYFRNLFVQEARIAASLAHPNLIQVFDFGKAADSYYLAMEFIDGWNLGQVLSQVRLRGMSIPLAVWRYWMEGILAGIGHLHLRGIVHRDISPSNVLLSRGGVVKITDFGIACGSLSETGRKPGWQGKYSYMSPEQARGEDASTASDLFAAAVISAEFFLPDRLVDEGTAEKTHSWLRRYDSRLLDLGVLPPAVVETVRKGLATSKSDRYADADEFSKAVIVAVPSSARPAELESFWNALFPDCPAEDDTVIDPQLPGKGSGVVRERRPRYGKGGRRLLKAGVPVVLAAMSIAGWAVVRGFVPRSSSPPDSARPASVSREIPPPRTAVRPDEKPGGPPLPVKLSTSATPRTGPSAGVSESAPKTVRIETDPLGVAVYLDDGTPLGRTPVSVDVAAWAGRKIRFRLEGYDGKSVPTDVLAQFTTFRLEMERQMGTVEVIQAIPWARVYDGDRYIGDTPLHDVKLPVGHHRLRFVNEPLAVERIHEINVQSGHNPKVIIPLVERKSSD